MMCWEQLIQTYLQTVLSSLRGTPLFPSFPQVRKEFLHSIYQFTSQITLSETLNQTCRCSSMIAPHFSLENKTNAIYRNFNPKSCTRNMNAYLLLKPQHFTCSPYQNYIPIVLQVHLGAGKPAKRHLLSLLQSLRHMSGVLSEGKEAEWFPCLYFPPWSQPTALWVMFLADSTRCYFILLGHATSLALRKEWIKLRHSRLHQQMPINKTVNYWCGQNFVDGF